MKSSIKPTIAPDVLVDTDFLEAGISNAAFRLRIFLDSIYGTQTTWGDVENFANKHVLDEEGSVTFDELVEELRANDLIEDADWE